MTNKGLLIFITVILVGIFAILIFQANDESPAEKFSDGVNETFEEIGDEIDDHTDAR